MSNAQSVKNQNTPAAGTPVAVLVVFCGLLMTLSGFTTDIMLPAFTTMVTDLDTTLDLVQGTLAAFAFSFGIGQFFYGPASDRFGRRPAIAVGLTIFLAGSLFATFGPNIETVLIGRALQGLGGGAAPVLARAILRDTHSGTALARAMALSMAIFAIGPIIAPLLGYIVVEYLGWRSTFGCTGLLALGLLMFNWLRFRETNACPNPDALRAGNLWAAVRTIVSNRQSTYFLACGCLAYCALFTYISNAPRIYAASFGITGFGFAALFATTGLGIVLGQAVNRTLLPRLGILIVLRIASTILLTASAAITLFAWLDMLNVFGFTALMFCFNTSFLVVVSNTATLCLDPHPTLAGVASAFYGCITNTSGAVFIATTVGLVGISILHWGVGMVLTTALCALAIWLASPDELVFKEV
ncbi:MAG: multidrug effflux MFS transporter [Rhizobiaceae bacterium]